MTSLIADLQLKTGIGGTSWSTIKITTNSSMHYSPLNGLIWASSATINQHFYVFGGVDSNNEYEPSNKVRVSIFQFKYLKSHYQNDR